MYKSKLQEYCQAKLWELPFYTTTKEGQDHCPQFKATVLVNGATYTAPRFCRTSKEAQNLVAQIVFNQLSGPSNANPTSSSRDLQQVSASSRNLQQQEGKETVHASSLTRTNLPIIEDEKQKGPSSAGPTSQVLASFGNLQEPEQTSSSASPTSLVSAPSRSFQLPLQDDKNHKDVGRIWKSQLQMYAQKRNLNLPVYISEREGPPHMLCFKSKVILDGKTYETEEYFGTIKDAENAAAKVALMSISADGIEEEDPCYFKNLLQELVQKEYSCLPLYNTTADGPSHIPRFISTVDIKEDSFTGQEAKTKKLAEAYAAKVAYSALKERAHLKGSEPMHVAGQLEVRQANNQAIQHTQGSNIKSLPFQLETSHPTQSPSKSGLKENNMAWDSPRAAAPQKKVKVFPHPPNMTLPPGTSIAHQDEKWIALTMDSIHGNA